MSKLVYRWLGLSAESFFALIGMLRGEGLAIRHADFYWHHHGWKWQACECLRQAVGFAASHIFYQLKFTGVGWPTSANLPTPLQAVDDNITQGAGRQQRKEDLNPRVKYWYEAML